MINKHEYGDTDGVTAIVVLAMASGFGLGIALGCSLGVRDGYKQGQIDAANGIQNYHLVQQSDGTTSWERKDTK